MSPCTVPVPISSWSTQAKAGPGVDLGQAGFWAPALGPYTYQTTAGLAVANRALLMRTVCPRSMTISKIGFSVVTAATADDACDVGIYSADLLTRLGSAGSRTGFLNSTGAKTVPLLASVALVAGTVYYVAWAQGTPGGTGVVCSVQAQATGAIVALFGAAVGTVEVCFRDASFPLPTSLPSPNVTSVPSVPIMALMQ